MVTVHKTVTIDRHSLVYTRVLCVVVFDCVVARMYAHVCVCHCVLCMIIVFTCLPHPPPPPSPGPGFMVMGCCTSPTEERLRLTGRMGGPLDKELE